MSKFLLTVCALGLFSSSAFAQEKSPEQMLEKQQLARVVTSGTNQRIGFFYAVNPDCSASGDVNVRVTKQPEHGTVVECALDGGQFQAAVLTGCWVCRSSYCAGLR